MTAEGIVVTVYFLLPGLLSLAVFEWIFVGRERSGVELTSLAIGISILSAAPILLFEDTRPLLAHLWDPSQLTAKGLAGVGLHVVVGVTLAAVTGLIIKYPFKGHIGPKSFYQRSWDWLWGNYGADDRYVLVNTDRALYYGQLAFADDPSVGRDLVLRDPASWDDEARDFYRDGMKYLYLPASEIVQCELSVANPLKETDRPFLGVGYIYGPRSEGENPNE